MRYCSESKTHRARKCSQGLTAKKKQNTYLILTKPCTKSAGFIRRGRRNIPTLSIKWAHASVGWFVDSWKTLILRFSQLVPSNKCTLSRCSYSFASRKEFSRAAFPQATQKSARFLPSSSWLPFNWKGEMDGGGGKRGKEDWITL